MWFLIVSISDLCPLTYIDQTQQSTNSFQHNFNRQNEQHPFQPDGDNEDNLNRGPLCFRCCQYGHFHQEYGVRMDHSRKFKLDQVYGQGLSIGKEKNQCPKVLNMVGSSNECDIMIEGIKCKALFDTRSCFSTLSQSFCDSHFKHIPLHPVEAILKLECADGSSMPYSGNVTLEIISAGIPSDNIQERIFLVVPEMDYNKTEPLIIGTNIPDELLLHCKSKIGENFLQNAALHTSWYLEFRSIVFRERGLRRN